MAPTFLVLTILPLLTFAAELHDLDEEQDNSAFPDSFHAPMLEGTEALIEEPTRIVSADGHVQMSRISPHAQKPFMRTEPGDPQKPKVPIRVHYGIMTNMGKRGQSLFRGQMETWAAELIKQGRYFAVVGQNATKNMPSDMKYMNDVLVPVACGDDGRSVQCKEATAFQVAYERPLDWLVRLDDDTYANSTEIDEYLASLGPVALKRPALLSMSIGCGIKTDLVKKNCPDIYEHGGICGGGGYAINREAMKTLESSPGGWAQLVADYQNYQKHGIAYGDMCTSCELNKRGIKIQQYYGTSAINGVMTSASWKTYMKQRPVMYHDLSPELMRWLYVNLLNKPQTEREAAEKLAFDEYGCCCQNSARARRWASPEKAVAACHAGNLNEKPVLCGYSKKLPDPAIQWLVR